MATEKLYYTEPYRQDFAATIERITELDNRHFAVVLDRTAMYPEGGGQPCDTGWLDNIPVLAVREDAGEIVHVMAQRPANCQVTGRVDWSRRFDHMQQHSGEHVLSGAFLTLFGAENIGFHLTTDAVYIDVTIEALSAEQAADAEAKANAAIFANIPVVTHLVTDQDLTKFPLRKLPTKGFDNLRLVEIAGIDCCPCCGTHVAATGEIGLIKIRNWERKSGATRVEFVCGARALADYHLNSVVARQLSVRLSTPVAELSAAVDRQFAKLETLNSELAATRQELGRLLSAELYRQAEPAGEGKTVVKLFTETPPLDLADLARQVLAHGPAIVLFGVANAENNKSQLLFACTPGRKTNMGTLLKSVLPLVDSKGGGNATWAQGGGPYSARLADALLTARQNILAL